jgi:putative NAD(+) diphosphatase
VIDEMGSENGVVQTGIDRDEGTRRSPSALAGAAQAPHARFLFVSGARVAVETGAERLLATPSEWLGPEVRSRAVYLGLARGIPYFACDVGNADDSAREVRIVSRKIPVFPHRSLADPERMTSAEIGVGVERAADIEIGAAGEKAAEAASDSEGVSVDFASVPLAAHLWSVLDAELAIEAVAISNWLGATRFCHRCGQPLTVRSGGWEKVCTRGHTVFPRVDPAVIMAIRDADDRLLLARNGQWPAGRLSVLAGFVEAGEPLESAVAREVFEEAGIVVDDVEYVTSQPWPFPRSLMLAFEGRTRARQEDVKVDGKELVFARFFSRDEFLRALADGEIGLPTPTSVSALLIERWLGRSLTVALAERA